jgi:hypothetical protein
MPTGSVLRRRCKGIVYREYKEGDVSLLERNCPWNKD